MDSRSATNYIGGKKQCYSSSLGMEKLYLDSSCSSMASSTLSASSYAKSSTLYSIPSNRANEFWSKFSRPSSHPEKRRSLWKLIKELITTNGKSNNNAINDKQTVLSERSKYLAEAEARTHPAGLYCVIDDFLETYTESVEDWVHPTVEEEYSEIVDNYAEVCQDWELDTENSGYSEIIDDVMKDHNMFNPDKSDRYYISLYTNLYEFHQKIN